MGFGFWISPACATGCLFPDVPLASLLDVKELVGATVAGGGRPESCGVGVAADISAHNDEMLLWKGRWVVEIREKQNQLRRDFPQSMFRGKLMFFQEQR